MRLEVLGCSGGIGAGRRTTSFLVDDDILIDAGTGATDLTLEQLVRIDHVFVSHSHLDHIAAIPLLLDTVGGQRSTALTVHALDATVKALREHIFNWRIWPDFTKIPNAEQPYLRFESMSIGEPVQLGERTIVTVAANHVVPTVGYLLSSTRGSLIFSADTTANNALWEAANRCENLRYLLIETAFSNKDQAIAHASKHLYPDLLALELKKYTGTAEIWVTHMKPGEEADIMAELERGIVGRTPSRLTQGQVLEF